ncbi:MAG: RDD family protein [Aureispira sp.]
MQETPLDTFSWTKEDPLVYPAWYQRLLAAFIDLLIVSLLMYVVSSLTPNYLRITAVVALLLAPLYKILMEGVDGQTLGKKLFGIRVVLDDGQKATIGLARANKRFLLFWPNYILLISIVFIDVDGFINEGIGLVISGLLMMTAFLSVLAVFSIFRNDRHQTLYDGIARTICIKTDYLF